MSLQEHRKAIDRLDKRIVELLNERTQHVLEIGALKTKAGEEIYAPHRELAVLERIAKLNNGPITTESLRAIYREVMSSALSLEKTMTIAYFGPEATFTHQAAIRKFGSSLNYSPHKTITDVFTEVSKRRADYGVVPIENSTEGVVTHTLDMFVDSDLKIVAQIILPIQQCLLGKGKKDQVKKIYSHPQPLAQCRTYLQHNFHETEIVETSSTTRAAELASREPNAAAIASSLAAERYNLQILDQDIQDTAINATRFLVLGRQCSPPTGKDRTSLMLSIADQVGALHGALAPFSRYKLNMTRIESRPNKRKAWEYFFFVDFDGHFLDKRVAQALAQVGKKCTFIKVLGSYPKGEETR
jgi:chorismate mutase/prephenate dehydratase